MAAGGSLVISAEKLQTSSARLMARGGEVSGAGGAIGLTTSGELSLGAGTMVASARAENESGGIVEINSGAKLQIASNIEANGGPNGAGGQIYLVYAHDTSPLEITGNVVADGIGTGASGDIYMRNNIESAPLNVFVTGTISASSTKGTVSTLYAQTSFNQPYVLTLTEEATMRGELRAVNNPSSVNIIGKGSNLKLSIGSITTTTGSIDIYLPGKNSTLELSGEFSRLESGEHISILAANLVVNGTIETTAENAHMSFSSNNSLSVSGMGKIIASGGGDDSFISFRAGAPGVGPLNPTADLNFAAQSPMVSARPLGSGNGGQIRLEAGRNIEMAISGSDSRVFNVSGVSTGRGGEIEISAGNTASVNGVFVAQGIGDNSDGGKVLVRAHHARASKLSIDTSAGSTGKGGAIQISSQDHGSTIDFGVELISRGGSTSGNGGNLLLEASTINLNGELRVECLGEGTGGIVTATGNKIISTNLVVDASAVTSGTGGIVFLHAANSLDIGTLEHPVDVIANGGSTKGSGGDITLIGDSSLSFTGRASTSARGDGDGGSGINLRSDGNLHVVGFIYADGIGSGDDTVLNSGSGGLIVLQGKSLQTEVDLLARSNGTGAGGHITVTSTTGDILYGSVIADVSVLGKEGTGGSISLRAPRGTIEMLHPQISVNGVGTGHGGNIELTAAEIVAPQPLNLQANSGTTGHGGRITITSSAKSDVLMDGAVISATGAAPVPGDTSVGTISIFSSGGLSYRGGTISSSSESQAGVVALKAANDGTLDLSQTTVTVNGSAGGKIVLSAPVVKSDGSTMLEANGSEQGGQIEITHNSTAQNLDFIGAITARGGTADKSGNGGSVVISSAAGLSVSNIITRPVNLGNGGDITLTVQGTNPVHSLKTELDTSSRGEGFKAGNVTLTAPTFELGTIKAEGQPGPGNVMGGTGGTVRITATANQELILNSISVDGGTIGKKDTGVPGFIIVSAPSDITLPANTALTANGDIHSSRSNSTIRILGAQVSPGKIQIDGDIRTSDHNQNAKIEIAGLRNRIDSSKS